MSVMTPTPPNENAEAGRLAGTGIWSGELRYGDPGQIAEAAAELDELGYSAIWIPDVGGKLFEAIETLMRSTRRATVATGILNLWMHTPEETAAAWHRFTSQFGSRLLLGIGVSHSILIDAQSPGRYQKPLGAMAGFLDGLDGAEPPLGQAHRVLAALGPKMLELARTRAAGAHPYNVTPEHTAQARSLLGPEPMLLPEQAVALTSDPSEGRRLGRMHLARYLPAVNYTNNLRRLGFGDDDFADGGSDRLVDAMVAWGKVDQIAGRVQEHRDAGADHVCVQVITDQGMPSSQWRELAPALT